MSNLIILETIKLTPVVELVPGNFSTQSRELPSAALRDCLDEWFNYWSDSLADSGIRDLQPIQRGSWHVPTANFSGRSNIQKFLEKTLQNWGGVDTLVDPDCRPVLNGGLALQCPAGETLIEPSCCCDLGEAKNWKEAAAYRKAEWWMLWIGHPWISVRYQSPWVILSSPDESNEPTGRWAVLPQELERAADEAQAKLNSFARRLAVVLPALGYADDALTMVRKLAGLYA